MSGDRLDLDAIEAWRWRAEDSRGLSAHGRENVDALLAEVRRLRALPDMTLGWDSNRGVMVFTDVDAAQRVTLREWIDSK